MLSFMRCCLILITCGQGKLSMFLTVETGSLDLPWLDNCTVIGHKSGLGRECVGMQANDSALSTFVDQLAISAHLRSWATQH